MDVYTAARGYRNWETRQSKVVGYASGGCVHQGPALAG